MKELGLIRGNQRIPRRSQTHHDYQLSEPSVMAIHAILQQLRVEEDGNPSRPSSPVPDQSQRPTEQKPAPRRRPALGPPRRSYSVTDREPIPHHHRPSAGITLMDLPPELHYAIFDFLDPIDSTCLGLTNSHFYSIHRRMHGTILLSTRREGPNELEWAWHLATAVVHTPQLGASSTPATEQEKNALSKLRVRGQAYCRKCGVTRCELHKHIQEWMGDGAEYCSVKKKFGLGAPSGAKPYCYMSKPGDPSRCGRHWVRKSKVILK